MANRTEALERKIGARMRTLRAAQKLSGYAVAAAAGVAPHYLYVLERGEHMPGVATLERIATALGTTTTYLLTGKR